MKQSTFGSLAYTTKKRVTRKEKFLSEMDSIIPWHEMECEIVPAYPHNRTGRQAMPLKQMLKIYFMQQWFSLSDPAMEDALYDVESMRRFAGIELGNDPVPDETTILKFRHLLERYDLTQRLFQVVKEHLDRKGFLLKEGTIVDATIIHAPSSTKNTYKERDPEMKQTRKGNQWYFGMKMHIGVDAESGIAHSVTHTGANVHDSQEMDNLLHGSETVLYGDRAYVDAKKKEEFESSGVTWNISRKAKPGRKLTKKDKAWNRTRSRTRAIVEHVFGVIKNLWGYRRVRYRGLYKNACQQFTLLALANLYLKRRVLSKVAA